MNGHRRIDGEHLQSPTREDSRGLLRSSLGRYRTLAAVLAAPCFVLAAAPLSPAPHGTATAPRSSPASSVALCAASGDRLPRTRSSWPINRPLGVARHREQLLEQRRIADIGRVGRLTPRVRRRPSEQPLRLRDGVGAPVVAL